MVLYRYRVSSQEHLKNSTSPPVFSGQRRSPRRTLVWMLAWSRLSLVELYRVVLIDETLGAQQKWLSDTSVVQWFQWFNRDIRNQQTTKYSAKTALSALCIPDLFVEHSFPSGPDLWELKRRLRRSMELQVTYGVHQCPTSFRLTPKRWRFHHPSRTSENLFWVPQKYWFAQAHAFTRECSCEVIGPGTFCLVFWAWAGWNQAVKVWFLSTKRVI